ncbi:hypothetical protein [Priestia megaterium]|uniref:hypothetical protein n=1 Tax=Priestia megaterium TaxID=1404 RepID=UPI0011A2534A|nr:hypothetical protein [Priestia megaterium]
MSKKKHKRLCPCGAKIYFDNCCKNPKEGETPEEVKKLINKVVKETFRKKGYYLGELCLYASFLTKELLIEYGIKSYVVAGSSKWNGYPTFFKYIPHNESPQFHAWLVTEYGEKVDLACDAIEDRFDAYTLSGPKLGIKPPSYCWDKKLKDREYIERNIGAKSFPVDQKVLSGLIMTAKESLNRLEKKKRQ